MPVRRIQNNETTARAEAQNQTKAPRNASCRPRTGTTGDPPHPSIFTHLVFARPFDRRAIKLCRRSFTNAVKLGNYDMLCSHNRAGRVPLRRKSDPNRVLPPSPPPLITKRKALKGTNELPHRQKKLTSSHLALFETAPIAALNTAKFGHSNESSSASCCNSLKAAMTSRHFPSLPKAFMQATTLSRRGERGTICDGSRTGAPQGDTCW